MHVCLLVGVFNKVLVCSCRHRALPCPAVKQSEEWGDPSKCEGAEGCQYCHTRTEQQFHPEVCPFRCDLSECRPEITSDENQHVLTSPSVADL